jgi:hypothetical protein
MHDFSYLQYVKSGFFRVLANIENQSPGKSFLLSVVKEKKEGSLHGLSITELMEKKNRK